LSGDPWTILGPCFAQLFEALCYKPEYWEFDIPWSHYTFGFAMTPDSTQSLTEMGTRNI
jgi:hypothetical protein